jgi:formiminotetrahydrofolate cyclodeaminase
MRNYSSRFRSYLYDLAKRRPAPGGGSVIVLAFCLGLSLIEKALNYSLDERVDKLKRSIFTLRLLRNKIFRYIDLDGELFEKILREKGTTRAHYLKQSEKILIDLGKSSIRAFLLAKGVENAIKKSIISDFSIGIELVRVSLMGCVLNLEANAFLFKRRSAYARTFRMTLEKWQTF